MDIPLDSPLRLFSQIWPVLFNFLDDAVLLGLSRLGFHYHWLQWLSPLLLAGSVMVWAVRLLQTQPWKRTVLKSPQS